MLAFQVRMLPIVGSLIRELLESVQMLAVLIAP